MNGFAGKDAANWKTVCIIQSKMQPFTLIPGSLLSIEFFDFAFCVIMLIFTLCSVLKICFLRTDSMHAGGARQQWMLGEMWWRFLGYAGVPHQPARERLADYCKMWSSRSNFELAFLRSVLHATDTFPVPFLKLLTEKSYSFS